MSPKSSRSLESVFKSALRVGAFWTLAVGLSVSSNTTFAQDCGCESGCDHSTACDSPGCGCGHSAGYRPLGLLDRIDSLGAKVEDRLHRLLHPFKKHGCSTCADPGCGVEANCGVEATCGIEAGCGVEAGCGIEAACGTEVPHLPHGEITAPVPHVEEALPEPSARNLRNRPTPNAPLPTSTPNTLEQEQPTEESNFDGKPAQLPDWLNNPFQDEARARRRVGSPGVPSKPAQWTKRTKNDSAANRYSGAYDAAAFIAKQREGEAAQGIAAAERTKSNARKLSGIRDLPASSTKTSRRIGPVVIGLTDRSKDAEATGSHESTTEESAVVSAAALAPVDEAPELQAPASSAKRDGAIVVPAAHNPLRQ